MTSMSQLPSSRGYDVLLLSMLSKFKYRFPVQIPVPSPFLSETLFCSDTRFVISILTHPVFVALERLATGTPSSGPRHSSSLETNYLQRLVSKHQADVDAMARDRRFNPEQRTVGQLRRGLKKAGLLAL